MRHKLVRDFQRQFGAAIASIRIELGITQMQVCEKTGFTQSYLSCIENGHRTPSMDALILIVEALNCDLNITITPRKGK